MRFLSLVTTFLVFLWPVLAQTPTATLCLTASVSTVTSPPSLCSATACANCGNGNFITSVVSTDLASISAGSSYMSMLVNTAPYQTRSIQSQAGMYGARIGYPQFQATQLACLSAGDISTLFNGLADIIDQLDGLITVATNGMVEALGEDDTTPRLKSWFSQLARRVQLSSYYLYLGNGCATNDQVTSINNKIDALTAKYPDLGQTDGAPTVPHLKSPCRDVLFYSYAPGSCIARSCRTNGPASGACDSCTIAATSVSSFQSKIAVATSSLSAAVTYAKGVPFQRSIFNAFMNMKTSAEFGASILIPASSCINSEQLSAYLSSPTGYINSLAWAIEQYALVEYPVGGPVVFANTFGVNSAETIQEFTAAIQGLISYPSSCYNCNDTAAYNAAITKFVERYKEYSIFSTGYSDLADVPLLSVDCIACPVSSESVVSSSLLATSASSNVFSSIQSTAASSDVSSVSLGATSVSSDAASMPVSSDVSSSSLASSPTSSPASSAEPTGVSSSAASIQSEGSTSSSVLASTSDSAVSAIPTSVAVSSLRYFNSSAFGSSINPEAASTSPAAAAAAAATASTHTFTSTAVVTEPCSKCAGGSTTFTAVSVITTLLPTAATEGQTHTFTTATVITEPCSKCPGGETTFLSTITGSAKIQSSYTTLSVVPGCSTCPAQILTLPAGVTTIATTTGLTPATTAATITATPATFTSATTSASTLPTEASKTIAGGVSVAVVPSAETSVVAANTANKLGWSLLAFLMLPMGFM